MSEEELKKLCKEEFLKNIKENIKSETIFTYVDGLEKENKKQKEVLDKIKEYGENCLENLKDQDEYIDESINVVALLRMIHKNYLELLEEIE